MACTKRKLVDAINSYASARTTGDRNLIQMSAQLLQNTIETLEFEPEPEIESETFVETAEN